MSCSVFYRRVTPKLGMAKVTQVDFPPRETVSYTKETQTPAPAQAKEGDLCFFFFFSKNLKSMLFLMQLCPVSTNFS